MMHISGYSYASAYPMATRNADRQKIENDFSKLLQDNGAEAVKTEAKKAKNSDEVKDSKTEFVPAELTKEQIDYIRNKYINNKYGEKLYFTDLVTDLYNMGAVSKEDYEVLTTPYYPLPVVDEDGNPVKWKEGEKGQYKGVLRETQSWEIFEPDDWYSYCRYKRNLYTIPLPGCGYSKNEIYQELGQMYGRVLDVLEDIYH